jgi:zinc transporter, ZIP family
VSGDVGGAVLAGRAVAYHVGDRLVDQAGGAQRQDLDGEPPSGSGAAMFIGALLDGVPEAFILGIGIALGDAVSLAFVTAVFVSNIAQGIAGTGAQSATSRR